MRYLLFAIVKVSYAAPQLTRTRRKQPVHTAVAVTTQIPNEGGLLTVSPATATVDPKKGIVSLTYQSAAALFEAAGRERDACERRFMLSDIPRGGLVTIRTAFPSTQKGYEGRFSLKITLNGRVVHTSVSPEKSAPWAPSQPALAGMTQLKFHAPIREEIRGEVRVTVIDKEDHSLSSFTLSGVEAMMERNAPVLKKLRDVRGCTPLSLQKKITFKGGGAARSPERLTKNGLFATISSYEGVSHALPLMGAFLKRVGEAPSVNTLPEEQPPWHTVTLVLSRGLLPTCKISLHNVVGNFVKLVPTPAPHPGLEAAKLEVRKIIATPFEVSLLCKGLSGRFLITPKEAVEMNRGQIGPLVVKAVEYTLSCEKARQKIGKEKRPLGELITRCEYLQEQHRLLTKLRLDLLVLGAYLKRQSGKESTAHALKTPFNSIARKHSYHARFLYFTASHALKQKLRYRRLPRTMPAEIRAYENARDPRMRSHYKRYKAALDKYNDRVKHEQRLTDRVKELGRYHHYYKLFQSFSEPLLDTKSSLKDTERSY